MSALVKYETARRALAECRSMDEVKGWADKAAAMQAYGRMAKDKTLEVDAAEIRIRAERRLGELISAQKLGAGLNRGTVLKGGTAQSSPVVVSDDRRSKPTLADAGVSKDLSSRAQKLAAVPEAEFEAEVGEWRERVKAEGARVSTRLEKAGEKALSAAPAEPYQLAEAQHTITELAEENETLRDKLAVESLLDGEEAKTQTTETLRELRALVKTLQAENAALKVSRDTYQREASEAKKSAIYWRKQAEKAGKAAA